MRSMHLSQRLAALEVKHANGELHLVALVTFVNPRASRNEPNSAVIYGERFDRRADEAEGQFVARLNELAHERRREGTWGTIVFMNEIDEAL